MSPPSAAACTADAGLPRRAALALPVALLLAGPRGARATGDAAPRVESSEAAGEVTGRITGLSAFAFPQVADALARPQAWCEMMALHLNTKACTLAQPAHAPPLLTLTVTRTHDQPPAQGFPLALEWRLLRRDAVALEVQLHGASGPFGTTGYRIALTAAPAPAGRSAIDFSYSCRFAAASRIALQTYLATVARNKVGFTVVGEGAGAQPVTGLRGVVERTAMRYFLAIDAWLAAAARPPGQQLRHRLEHWFDGTERHARQLHEMDKTSYVAMKLREAGLRSTAPTP